MKTTGVSGKKDRLLAILSKLSLGQLLDLANARHDKQDLIKVLMTLTNNDERYFDEIFAEATKLDFKNKQGD